MSGLSQNLEPMGLSFHDGKRPAGSTITPWGGGGGGGESIGVGSDTLASSHITLTTSKGGTVAANTEQRKCSKYSHLDRSLHFFLVAVQRLINFSMN